MLHDLSPIHTSFQDVPRLGARPSGTCSIIPCMVNNNTCRYIENYMIPSVVARDRRE